MRWRPREPVLAELGGGARPRRRGGDRARQPRSPAARRLARAPRAGRRPRRRSGSRRRSTGAPASRWPRSRSALGPARVRAAYPGVWLREDVYATHGHYLDRHTTVPMFERLGAGAMARIVRRAAGGPRRAPRTTRRAGADLRLDPRAGPDGGAGRRRRPHGASAQAWRVLQQRGGDARLAAPGARAALFRCVRGAQPRRARAAARRHLAAPSCAGRRCAAMARCSTGWRRAPPRDLRPHPPRRPAARRRARRVAHAGTGARLLNTGCWVHEPRLPRAATRAEPLPAGLRACGSTTTGRRSWSTCSMTAVGAGRRSGSPRPGVKQTAWQRDPVATSSSSSRRPCCAGAR